MDLTTNLLARRFVGLFAASVFLVAGVSALALQPSRPAPTLREVADVREELKRLRTVPTGEVIQTNLGSQGSWILGVGFLHPDAEGAWMSQTSAAVKFNVSGGREPVSVRLGLEPLVAASSRERAVTVSSSIDSVTTLLTGGSQFVLVALDGQRDQEIQIACDVVASPISLELGPDRRAFCSRLLSVEVVAEVG